MVDVEIRGWTNASERDLMNFISRKTGIALQNMQSNMSTGILTASVHNMKQAKDLERCTGMRFAGNTLRIAITNSFGLDGGSSQNTMNTVQLLRNFLQARYNAAAKMLDLTNMINDPSLVQNGLFSNVRTSTKGFTAMMRLAKHDNMQIDSINLSSNRIDDNCKYMYDLEMNYPNLKNLAIGSNNIMRIEFFDRMKNKFPKLRELIITSNPIMNNASQTIMNRIVSFFPRLIILNGQQVRDEARVNALYSFPVAKKAMFFETPALSKVATNFVATFINMWDQERTNLMQLYTPDSRFSYQIDTTHMGSMDSSVSINWSNYIPHSRNLKRVSGARARQMRLAIGPEAIKNAFQSLPKTKHSLQENPDLYSMEVISFPQLNGMQITVHGEFKETAKADNPMSDHRPGRGKYNSNNNGAVKLTKKSFDRTFIVIPGPGGSFIVASDMLLIKPYSGNSAWAEHRNLPSAPVNSTPVQPAMAPSTPITPTASLPADVTAKLTPVQQQLLVKVMGETRLNLQFALMLCEQSNWNYVAAGQNFQNSKSQIPPQAYQ